MNHRLDDIHSGLLSGLAAAESLKTWLRDRPAGYDRAEAFGRACADGLRALEELRTQLRDGRKHVEEASGEPPSQCYCNATSHPPCGFCESRAGEEQP